MKILYSYQSYDLIATSGTSKSFPRSKIEDFFFPAANNLWDPVTHLPIGLLGNGRRESVYLDHLPGCT